MILVNFVNKIKFLEFVFVVDDNFHPFFIIIIIIIIDSLFFFVSNKNLNTL
jgi:hypothetical protein